MNTQDTICAIATAPGTSAIAVLRVSGPDTFGICRKVVVFAAPHKSWDAVKGYSLHHAEVCHQGQTIDEITLALYKAPRSYTGEDAAEFFCHGSVYIQQRILQLLIEAGARLALPGEFTLRAFLHGKLDLAQAESVADLIAAQTESARRLAFQQLKGGYSLEITRLRDELVRFSALVELELDFSEEDVEFADRTQLADLLDKVCRMLERLSESFVLGNALKNGVPVAIIGEPNVGKSTLLNSLLNEDRAIVSEIEGTTRDTIEDVINIGGITFRFIDTAGLRQTDDVIENLGISRTYLKIEQATVVLLLIDARDAIQKSLQSVQGIKTHIAGLPARQRPRLVVVVNKVDEVSDYLLDTLLTRVNFHMLEADDGFVHLSAKNKTNIRELVDLLSGTVSRAQVAENEVIVSNIRHYEAFRNTLEALRRAQEALAARLPGDLLAQDIRQAIHHLSGITGAVAPDDVLRHIFSTFCIGK